jgi:streptogramin lyase
VATRWGLIVASLIVAGMVMFFGIIALSIYFSMPSRNTAQTVPRPPVPSFPGIKPQPPTDSGFAKVVLKFGSEGIGPGTFTDARSIAVDEAGHIYVGEYSGGRIQVFDAGGKFLTQWMVDPKMPLRQLAADRKGTVYVVQKGDISLYEGSTGKPLGKLQRAESSGNYDDVVTTLGGGMVAVNRGEDIVSLDERGAVVRIIKASISEQSGDSELGTRVAVDGLGNTYALGTFNEAVFKFGPNGKYITRFGGKGSEPGQFRAPHSIAVDGQGRIYVGDIKGIQVFDADGRYLDLFKLERDLPFGMVFNDRNELFVAARTRVYKFAVK